MFLTVTTDAAAMADVSGLSRRKLLGVLGGTAAAKFDGTTTTV
jgi:hypothetical protein